MHEITNEDLKLVLSQSASPQTPKLILEALDSDKKVAEITTLTGGSLTVNPESEVRRSGSFTIQPSVKERIRLHPDHPIWLNKDLRLKLGLYHIREKKYKYYTLAYFIYENTSSTYDAATDQISFHCSDFMRKLDGTKNGQLGAPTIQFDAYEKGEDGEPLTDDEGNILKYNTIKSAVTRVLEQLGGITKYRIDEIGEYLALPEYNEDWALYREEHETWNALPHDETFSCGCSVLSILTAFRDLYPNYEMFFDPFDENRFICQTIPFCYEDDIVLDNQFLQKVLVSENVSVDLSAVRNICEVWGKSLTTTYRTEKCTYSDPVFSCTVDGFDTKYYNGDTVCVKLPEPELPWDKSENRLKLNINGIGAMEIYDENTDAPIRPDTLKSNLSYSFKIKSVKVQGKYIFRVYLLGQYQAHAIDVLTSKPILPKKPEDTESTGHSQISSHTNGKTDKTAGKNEENTDETTLYSIEYFQQKYNCENIHFTVIPNSPFTIQELGEILDVKTGSGYDTITSDSLAMDKAIYENRKNCRLTDQITITTLLLPFLDVNIKVSYKPRDCKEERQYIIKSVSHDFAGFTSTITMYRFYPAFRPQQTESGTHKTLAGYSHKTLNKFTQKELTTLIDKEEL